MRAFLTCCLLAVFCGDAVFAVPREVQKEIPNAALKGKTKFQLLNKELYSAELWLIKGQSFSFDRQFALSLTYGTSINASVLSWASISEIARHEGISKNAFDELGFTLTSCFSDVKKGDQITGVAKAQNEIAFYINGAKSCDLTYPNIRSRFFGIWLGPKTRDPSGAAALRGE